MVQTLLLVMLFVGGVALLPWAVRRWQGQNALGQGARGMNSKVVSAVAVGPQQRVVTVEVGPEDGRTWLVLGVTAQQIQCLHVLPCATEKSISQSGKPSTEFSQEMATLMAERGDRS